MTQYQRIATKLTRELQIRAGAITADQVERVANGTERTVSHPVISAVMAELKRRNLCPKT